MKKITLLTELWTAETGEMTPTMKVKRKVITENHKEAIEGMDS
ncbi:hypothetical protein [Hymenobacter negativus]|nr:MULTISPECIES: hypothetical protein [Bacteria]